MTPYLSVIIPTFNEEKRLPQSLDVILFFLKSQNYESEIIISDDGSQDHTVQAAQEKLKNFRHLILTETKNRGKGHAVRQGMLAAAGQYLLFSDADLSTPIEEVNRFLGYLEKDFDVVIGSRALPESQVVIHQTVLRETMGRVFNLLARLLSFHDVRDSQCGFKCFRYRVAQEIFRLQRLDGFSFDSEIVYLVQKKGFRLLEAPVTWKNSAQTRVRLLSDPIKMLLDLFKIRWLHRNL